MLRAFNQPHEGGWPIVDYSKQAKMVSNTLMEMFPNFKDKECNSVEIVWLEDEVVEQLIKEIDCATFSFDIEFIKCQGLKCYDHRSKFEPTQRKGRPRIVVDAGRTPSYIIFTDRKHNPVVVLNMYHKNFNLWAERIDLRATMKQRTNNPSTHFVYRSKAEELGYAWFNRDYTMTTLMSTKDTANKHDN